MRSRLPSVTLHDLEAHARRWARDAQHPTHVRVEGRAPLGVLNVADFTERYGVERFAVVLDLFRAHARAEGVDPYLVGMVGWVDDRTADLCAALPLDAVTGYGLLPTWTGARTQDYDLLVRLRVAEWHAVQRRLAVPFFPVVCAGWDATPRSRPVDDLPPLGYPYTPVVVGETPQAFRRFLEHALAFNRAHLPRPDLVFLHALNEWTEGAALEPSTRHGDALLQVVRDVAVAAGRGGPR